MVKDAEAICSSALMDWQKLDALNTFVLTKASYQLSAFTVDRTWCQRVDAQVRRVVKKAMMLPKRTVSSFLYTAKHHGGLGLTSIEDILDVTKVNRLIRCLSSPDKKVTDVAWDQLSNVVRKRRDIDDIGDADLQEFLNTTPTRGEYRLGDVMSLWSTARKSIKNLGCKLIFEGMEVQLATEEETVNARDRKAVRWLLNEARDSNRLKQLLQARDQGRAFHLASKHPSSSHWIKDGLP